MIRAFPFITFTFSHYTQPNFVLSTIGYPPSPARNSAIKVWHDLWQLILLRLNLFLNFISDLPYLLKGIFILFTTKTDRFDESFIADDLALTQTIAELIFSDFNKTLVTDNYFWLTSRFNLLKIFFLAKVVSDPFDFQKDVTFYNFFMYGYFSFIWWFGCFCVMEVSFMMRILLNAWAILRIRTRWIQ